MKLKEQEDHLEVTNNGNVAVFLGIIFAAIGAVFIFVIGPGSMEGSDLLMLLIPVVFILVGIIIVLTAKKTVVRLRKEGVSTVTHTRVVTRRVKERTLESDDIIAVSVETGLQHSSSSSSRNSRGPQQRNNFKSTTYYKIELADGRSVPVGSKTRNGIWDDHIGYQVVERIADYLGVDVVDNGVEKPVGMYRNHRLSSQRGRGRGGRF